MTDQSPSREAVEVTQGDRDAAAEAMSGILSGLTCEHIRLGRYDDDEMVQAPARHRLAARRGAIEEAAKVAMSRAEILAECEGELLMAQGREAECIAAAIRGIGVE